MFGGNDYPLNSYITDLIGQTKSSTQSGGNGDVGCGCGGARVRSSKRKKGKKVKKQKTNRKRGKLLGKTIKNQEPLH